MNDISTPSIARKKIANGADYIDSLRGRGLQVWLFGEKVSEPVDHPIIRLINHTWILHIHQAHIQVPSLISN